VVKVHLEKVFEPNAEHTYTSIFGGKFNLKTTEAQLHEAYVRDLDTNFLSFVEKPPDRDRRPLVVDVDKVPPEIFREGEIVTEIAEVFTALIGERLEGVASTDLVYLEQTKGPQFFNAHLIWKSVVLTERTAIYITRLATEVMKRRYPENNWESIIDACVTGANGLRMLGSWKPMNIDTLRRKYPDIWNSHYQPDEYGVLTKNISRVTKKPYLLPDLDGGVYMPKGHVGKLTAEIIAQHSIIVDANSKVFDVKPEYAEDLDATTSKRKAAPSRDKTKRDKRADKIENEATAGMVDTVADFLTKHGGHEGVYLKTSYPMNTATGTERVLSCGTTGPRTCFCDRDRVHNSNGFYVRWRPDGVTYVCFSQHCKHAPKEMENIQALHMRRLQMKEQNLSAHMTIQVPPGWDHETTDARWVKPLADDLRRNKTVCTKAPMGSGKTTAMKAAIADLKPKSIAFLSARRLFADSFYADMKEEMQQIEHYKNIVGDIRADFVIVQMESLYRIQDEKVYDMLVIDESESCFKNLSSVTMDNKIVAISNTFERLTKAANYVIVLDAFLSTRSTMGMHLVDEHTKGKIIDYVQQPIKRRGIHVKAIKQLFNLIVEKTKRGEKSYFFCGSKRLADEFAKILDGLDNIKYLYYNRDMKKATRDTMKDVMTSWSEVDVVITTPCVTVGINYELERIPGGWLPKHQFDAAYVYVSNQGCCPRDIMQSICRVRSYKSNDVYFTFADSCTRQETAVTNDMVNASVEARLQEAENGVENSEFWRESKWVRKITFINRVEEEMKVYQSVKQTLAFSSLAGVTVSEGDALTEYNAPDDDPDANQNHGERGTVLAHEPYDDIPCVTFEENSKIYSRSLAGEATVGELAQMAKHGFIHDPHLIAHGRRSKTIVALMFDRIWVHQDLRDKLKNLFYHGLDGKRYERIDAGDRRKRGLKFNSQMGAARMRMMDHIISLIHDEGDGPTEERSVLLTEHTHVDKMRLERCVEYVHARKEAIFNTFGMQLKANRKETDTFGFKLQTLNAVLSAWGFTKIGSKQKRIKKVSHQEYHVGSNVPGLSLIQIYSVVRENKFGCETEDAEGADNPANKKPRINPKT
jgi:hypothetical protein